MIVLPNNKIIMYNVHLASLKKKQHDLQISSEKKQGRWLRRYHTQVKPNLLDHYDARINSFVRQMEQKPIIIPDQLLKSQIQKKSQSFFRFKDPKDFSSLLTSLERTQLALNQKIMQKRFGDPALAHKSLASQSEYKPLSQFQYRARDKIKEIKQLETTKQKLYRKMVEERKSRIKLKQRKQVKTEQADIHATGLQYRLGDQKSQSTSVVNEDVSLRQTAHAPSRQDLEKQAIQYEKMMEIHEKKIHFKKLIDLSQNMQDPKGRKALKQLLEKCGMKRYRNQSSHQESEEDLLGSKIYK